MPWKESTAMSERRRFIEDLQYSGKNMSTLCAEYGISRQTGYFWKNRVKREGEAGLRERSKKPHHSPNKTSQEMERICCGLREVYPIWAGDKIRRHLLNAGYKNVPSEKTIDRILKRHGFISEEESEKHTAWRRFEHEHPNDLWQMDFKGDVRIGNKVCYPLTILDDHSRFCLCVEVCVDQKADTVKTVLTRIFKKYGLPKRMTMDNGPPWGHTSRHPHTQLTTWLMRQGIYVSHSRPCHPQTQGKLERMHRTLKAELLSLYKFANFEELQEGFDEWRRVYNTIRPHAALNLDLPSDHYQKSDQAFSNALPEIAYDDSFTVRKVQHDGEISFHGKLYRIGKAFHGYPVGLKPSEEEAMMEVYFCQQKVGRIDLKSPLP